MPTLPSALGGLLLPGQPVKLRAAIYVRKSTKDTEGRTKSLEEQLRHCHMVCERYGLEVSEERLYGEELGQKGDWYWDDGTDRFPKPYRPALTRLMRDIDAGLVDAVVLWRSDRLYRDAGVCDALMCVFRARGIRFIAGVRDMDITSASGLFQATTEAANNRRWRDTISEDIRRDHLFKAELGMFSRDPSCLGFRSRGRGTQEVHCVDEELALVQRIFTLFVYGEGERGPMGSMGIANYLMDQGVVWPKGVKGHKPRYREKIHEPQVRTVLTNCMYVGRWRHDGQEYPCDKLLVPVLDAQGHPTAQRQTAVPVALYELAQEKLARSKRPGKKSLGGPHLTTGLTLCGRCGRPLQVCYSHGKVEKGPRRGERRPPVPKFICSRRRGTRPCPAGSCFGLQEGVLDAWVRHELAPLLVCQMQAMRASAGRAADLEALALTERKLAEARKRETQKLALLLDALDATQFSAVAAQLRAEREALERQARALRDRVERLEHLMPDLSAETLAKQPQAAVKEALCRAIAWIGIGRAGTGIVVLTRWGAYIGARFRKGDRASGEVVHKTYLASPTPLDTLTCLAWLADPEEFVRGRRDALGRVAEGLSDAELLPGLLPGEDEIYEMDAEMPDPAEADPASEEE